MSHRFDTALLNRHRERQLLAEALESKFAAERRRSSVLRFIVTGVIACAGYVACQGLYALKPDVQRPILAQVKKQAGEGAALVVGAPMPEPPKNRRVSAEPRNFEAEKVPLNLFGDLRGAKKALASPPGYEPAGARSQQELIRLQTNRGRRVPFACANYAPARPQDLRKLAPIGLRPKDPAPPAQYELVKSVPLALATDERSFPRISR